MWWTPCALRRREQGPGCCGSCVVRRRSTSRDATPPQSPRTPTLAGSFPRERADLVGLQLSGDEAGRPPVAKSATHRGGPLEPAGDGIPGQPFGPGDRRPADTLNAQRNNRVERCSAMLETVVGGALCRRERLSALDASVSTPFPGRGSVESVADDVAGLDVSVQGTRGIETARFLHCAWALSSTVLWYSHDGPNCSM